MCTLGLSNVLELAGPSSSKTTRVFNTARDLGLTKWTPPTNGSTRSGFLHDAVECILDDQAVSRRSSAPATPTQFQPTSKDNWHPAFKLPSNLGTKFQPEHDSTTPALPTPGETPEDRSTNHWLRYITGAETADYTNSHIASQHSRDRILLPQQSHSYPQLQRPRSIRMSNSLQQLPRLAIQQKEIVLPATPPLPTTTRGPPQVRANPRLQLISRYNNVNGGNTTLLYSKTSAPELSLMA